ncbi:hypothetical protein AC1031_019384 [Aphanomyces cochlioides]|nr:hypothetical protein AC1031_019384 [Aphanomyces cochlioides]
MSNLRQLSESVVCSLPFVSLIAVTIIAVVALFLHGNPQIKRARVLLRQRRPSTADTIIIESPKFPAFTADCSALPLARTLLYRFLLGFVPPHAMNSSESNSMPSITTIASVLVAAVGVFLTSPGQGVLVYLNVVSISPWFDFSKPAEPQLGFNGLPRTTNLYLSSTDNVTIGVWHTRASHRADKVVLYLHGNGENRAIHVGVLKHALYSNSPFQADVLSPDYRGMAVFLHSV